jgi:demethylmenaquinone methyltransferase/2-methoxy-6-polyprenyl-1,4-benzoquinol methylase
MQNPKFIQAMFSELAPRYDLANRVFTGGMDVAWRRQVARLVRDIRPARVLDLATGSGDLALELQSRLDPGAQVVAADFCEPMLEQARRKGVREVIQADGMAMPFADGAFDALTIGFGLRNMADYPGAVREMARVLRPGGRLVILDTSTPPWWVRPFYNLYATHIMPRLCGLLTGRPDAYRYLAASAKAFPSGEAMLHLLLENGFDQARAFPLCLGSVSIYVARRG